MLRMLIVVVFFVAIARGLIAADHVRDLQALAVEQEAAPWGYWGPDPSRYSSWTSHSNRLIPVYTFGGDLETVAGPESIYRKERALPELYGDVPQGTFHPEAEYFDQTDIYRLQRLATEAGKKHIILVVFDGMDWQTIWAAATYSSGAVTYREGRGAGLCFQDYRGAPTDFGYCVTSPHSGAAKVDVDNQEIVRLSKQRGGYNAELGGFAPWSVASDPQYLIGRSEALRHAYTDSAASATSLTCGIKTYNDAINVDAEGRPCIPIARQLQKEGYAIGVVTNVPVCHATPASAYASNVSRGDYQDLTRDMLGRRSISHPEEPLPGVDVLLGAGWGENAREDGGQGANFVPGNRYLASDDRRAVAAENDGPYVFVERQTGTTGAAALRIAADRAIRDQRRLFGLFGVAGGHLPFRTADGDYHPTVSVNAEAEEYTPADIRENPTLSDMTSAALDVLCSRSDRFWLMVEAGDVDWANHKNNIDNAIGAVLSGDEAFRRITDWIEARDAWDDSLVIVTADHGHYLVLTRPDMLVMDREQSDVP